MKRHLWNLVHIWRAVGWPGWVAAALALACAGCVVVGTLLSMAAAIYPANFAARMVPASALRSNV